MLCSWQKIFYARFNRTPDKEEERELLMRGAYLETQDDPQWQEIIAQYAHELRMNHAADRIERSIKENGANTYRGRLYFGIFGLIFFIIGNTSGYVLGRNGRPYWSYHETGIIQLVAFLFNFPVGWFIFGFAIWLLYYEVRDAYYEIESAKAMRREPFFKQVRYWGCIFLLIFIFIFGVLIHGVWQY